MKRVLSNSYRGYTASISLDEEKSVYVGAVEEADIGFSGRTGDEAIYASSTAPTYTDFSSSNEMLAV